MSKQHKYFVTIDGGYSEGKHHVFSVQVNAEVFHSLHERAFEQGLIPAKYVKRVLADAAKNPKRQRRVSIFGFLFS